MKFKNTIIVSLLLAMTICLIFFYLFSSSERGAKEIDNHNSDKPAKSGKLTARSDHADSNNTGGIKNPKNQEKKNIPNADHGMIVEEDFFSTLINDLKSGSISMREAIERSENLNDQQNKEQAFVMLGKYFAENQGLELLQYSLELKPNANRERLLGSFMQVFHVETLEDFDFLQNWFNSSGFAEDKELVMNNLSSLIRSLKYEEIKGLYSRGYVTGFDELSRKRIIGRAVEDLIPSTNMGNFEDNLQRLSTDFDGEAEKRYLEVLAYNVTIEKGESFLPLVEKHGYDPADFLCNMVITNTNTDAKKSFPRIIKIADKYAAVEAVKHAAKAWVLEDSLEFSDYYIKNLQGNKYSGAIVDVIIEYLEGKGDKLGAEQWRKVNK
jgi:hypothetical protein